MTDTRTMDSLVDQQADQQTQFDELETRLALDYGVRRDRVHELVEAERDRFADARVHAFLSILIERSIKARLATDPPEQD